MGKSRKPAPEQIQKDEGDEPDGNELVDLKVKEVSLVNKPAIRRKFSVTKKLEDGEVDPSGATDPPEAPKTIDIEVQKNVAPLMTQLVEERVAVMGGVLDGMVAMLNAGKLTSDQAWKQFSVLYNMMYKLEGEVTSLADALSLPKMEVVEKQEESRNRAALKALIKSINSEKEEADMGTAQGTPADVKKNEGDGTDPQQAAIVKAVTDAVGPAVDAKLTPLVERLTKLEAAAAPATEVAKTESKPEEKPDLEKLITAAVTKGLEPVAADIVKITKRLDTLEGNPATTETKEPPAKVEKGEPKPGSDKFWGSVLGG